MNVYRLAVCEDDDTIREELSSLCQDILTQDSIEHEITAFSSADELEKRLLTENTPFDLLLLDIQMEGMTGMELAQSLRRRGDRVSILFISGCEDYLPEGYGVQPIHFLLKPVSREALADALRTDWRLNHRPKTAALRIGGKTVSLPLAEIRYIESYNHNIVIHQASGDRSYLLSLSEAEKQLPPGQFCRCHNSFIVNLFHIRRVSSRTIYLTDGRNLSIGRRYMEQFQDQFVRYLNQN